MSNLFASKAELKNERIEIPVNFVSNLFQNIDWSQNGFTDPSKIQSKLEAIMFITILFSEVLRSRIKSVFKSVICTQNAFGSAISPGLRGRPDESFISKVLALCTRRFSILEPVKNLSVFVRFILSPKEGIFCVQNEKQSLGSV